MAVNLTGSQIMDQFTIPVHPSEGDRLCDACGEALKPAPSGEPFSCPRCGRRAFLAILPNYAGVEEFTWSLHTDAEIRLLCRHCAWLGPLATLKRPRGY